MNGEASEQSSATRLRNYRRLAREVLAHMRRRDFQPTEERLICLLVEFSFLNGPARDFAVLPEQTEIARLLNVSKSRVSPAMKALVADKVLERKSLGIRLLPPGTWKRPLRNQRDPEAQLLLEDWLRTNPHQSLLELFAPSLNEGLMETWLQTGAEAESPVPKNVTENRSTSKIPPSSVTKSGTASPAYIHDRNQHDPNIMTHATAGFLGKEFEVGALGKKSAGEILERVQAAAPGLSPEFLDDWRRRIRENARLVWFVATEAEQRTDLGNPAGWMNRAYLREMGFAK